MRKFRHDNDNDNPGLAIVICCLLFGFLLIASSMKSNAFAHEPCEVQSFDQRTLVNVAIDACVKQCSMTEKRCNRSNFTMCIEKVLEIITYENRNSLFNYPPPE